MTSNNNTLSVRIDAFEARMDRLENLLLARFGGAPQVAEEATGRVAKPAKKGKKAKATKATKVTKADAPSKVRFLTQDSRLDFIKAHDWAVDRTSTSQLARLVVQGMPLAEGWEVGPKYRAKFEGEAPVIKAPKVKKAKAEPEVDLVAVIEAKRPARMTPEWIAQAHPTDGPRNAKGHTTPKAEWVQREALAQQGGWTREQIDMIVAG